MSAASGVGVVGAGIVGLACARALADAGHAVRVYERARPGAGQSVGTTRIFRHGPDPRLLALGVRARRGWAAWEKRFGRELIGPGGALLVGEDALERHDLLSAAGVRARLLDAGGQRAALGLFSPVEAPAMLDEDGGPIRARTAVEALARSLDDIFPADVLAVGPSAAGAEVFTGQGAFAHDAVVVCAGADTARLAAPLGVDLPVALACHLRATFAVRDGPRSTLACLQDRTGAHGERVYGSPVPGDGAYAVGLAGEDGALEGGTPGADGLAALRDRLAAYARRALPGVEPEPVRSRVCWVTSLPWGHDGVGAWRRGAVTFVAGNNLFKLAPALGDLLAAAVEEGEVPAMLRPEERLGGVHRGA